MRITAAAGGLVAVALLPSWACAKLVQTSLDITWGTGAPDGQTRQLILVNGTMPGPNLIFDEDDDVEVTVRSHIDDPVTVHFHGLLQQGTPWSDGVPGLGQSPIYNNGTFVHRFKASPAGSYWYHSHTRQTMVDGLFGGIFIRPKPDTPFPFHMISNSTDDIAAMQKAVANPQLLVMSDWDHLTSAEVWNATLESKLMLFCVDSILLNGKGQVLCPGQDFLINHTQSGVGGSIAPKTVSDKGCLPFTPAIDEVWLDIGDESKIPAGYQSGCVPTDGQRETIWVDPQDKWVSLNWIGAATYKTPQPSIDEHDMWVYEVDGSYIEPIKVQAFNFWAGERVSVLVKLDKTPGTYTMHMGDYGATQVIDAYADFRYKGPSNRTGPSQPWTQYGGLPVNDSVNILSPWLLFNDPIKIYPQDLPMKGPADQEEMLFVGRTNSSYDYTITGRAMYPVDWLSDKPFIYDIDSDDAHNRDLVIRTKNGTWVDLIMQLGENPGDATPFTHVLHKHGSKTWKIAQGHGRFNWSSVAEAMEQAPEVFNWETPGLRDTWLTMGNEISWQVLRYYVDNPGPWFVHCHIETHLQGGMGMTILDGVDAWPTIPPEYAPGHNGIIGGGNQTSNGTQTGTGGGIYTNGTATTTTTTTSSGASRPAQTQPTQYQPGQSQPSSPSQQTTQSLPGGGPQPEQSAPTPAAPAQSGAATDNEPADQEHSPDTPTSTPATVPESTPPACGCPAPSSSWSSSSSGEDDGNSPSPRHNGWGPYAPAPAWSHADGNHDLPYHWE